MITPIEIQGKNFKSGIGYDKKDVDGFLNDILVDYESLFKINAELNEKISLVEEKLNYYESIEKTLQKALILAEKTSEDTKNAAARESVLIIDEARLKAKSIVKDAKNDVENLHKKSIDLVQQYELYKAQFKQLSKAQTELLESDAFKIQIANLSALVSNDDEPVSNTSEEGDVKPTSQDLDDVNSDDLKTDDVKSGDVKSDDVKSDYDIEFFNLSDSE